MDALLSVLQDNRPHPRVFAQQITRALLGRLTGEHQIETTHRVLQLMHGEEFISMEKVILHVPNLEEVGSSYLLNAA